MIRLEPVTERTFKQILDMKLSAEQSRFVAPNIVSMAQAWLYRDEARPMAVCNDDEVVGFLMLDWDEGERNAGVWRFMIASNQQGKGYGRAALAAAIELVKAAGCFDMMNLDYVPGNDRARSLYASLGFCENGEVEDGEIVMTLPLTDTPRVGALTADEDDLEDFTALLTELARTGRAIPQALRDEASLAALIEAKRVIRLTLMAQTIGLYADGTLLLYEDMETRRAETEVLLQERK